MSLALQGRAQGSCHRLGQSGASLRTAPFGAPRAWRRCTHSYALCHTGIRMSRKVHEAMLLRSRPLSLAPCPYLFAISPYSLSFPSISPCLFVPCFSVFSMRLWRLSPVRGNSMGDAARRPAPLRLRFARSCGRAGRPPVSLSQAWTRRAREGTFRKTTLRVSPPCLTHPSIRWWSPVICPEEDASVTTSILLSYVTRNLSLFVGRCFRIRHDKSRTCFGSP